MAGITKSRDVNRAVMLAYHVTVLTGKGIVDVGAERCRGKNRKSINVITAELQRSRSLWS
jgi:hypothetical protein